MKLSAILISSIRTRLACAIALIEALCFLQINGEKLSNIVETEWISMKAYNNGPLPILSQPITFSIQISPPIYPPFFYKIYFRDAEQQFDMIEVDTQGSFEKNVFLRPLKKAKPGQIRMEISAELWMGYYPITLSASTSTTFNITQVNMNGSITIYQPNVPSWFAEKHYAALEQSVTFKVTLDEEKPTSRNQRWYRWAINDKFVKITQEPNMRFQFVNPGKYEVTIEVMANNAEHMANAKANILKYFVIVLNGILVGQANQVSISNISISNTVINLI